MARQQNGSWLISGKVGDKIYVIRDGKNYVRSLPTKTSKSPTEKQLAHRAKFGLVTQFLLPIAPLLNESYKKVNKKRSGFQMAVRQVFAEAVSGAYPNLEIDPSKASLLHGRLNSPFGEMTYVAGTCELDFYWPLHAQDYGNPTDELCALIWCRSLNEFYSKFDLGIKREQEFCTLKIPQSFKCSELHVWLFYRSVDHRAYSNSVYMGNVRLNSLPFQFQRPSCNVQFKNEYP